MGSVLVETIGEMVFIRKKKFSNTNLLPSRHIKREKASVPVDMCRSKTSLLPISSRGEGGYIKVTRMLVRKLNFTLWLFVPLMELQANKGGLKLKTDS